MKKLFGLILVLALCGFAFADINIYLTDAAGNSQISMRPSDTIALLLWTDTSNVTGFDDEVSVLSDNGNIIGGAITATGRDTIYDGVMMPGISGGDIEVTGACDLGSHMGTGVANPLALIYFHCDGPETVVLTVDNFIDDGTFVNQIPQNVIFHGLTIVQPEPATIALLCLGGLLLRKRS